MPNHLRAVPDCRADAEVHDLSSVMEVMESLESSHVRNAREVLAAMVHVMHEREIVVSGVQPEDQQSGEPSRKHKPEHPQMASAPVIMTKSGVLMNALGSAWCCA
jgi:hypothetical protein